MEKKYAAKIVAWMNSKKLLDTELYEIYEYGFELLISSSICVLGVVLIGFVSKKLMFSIGYLLGFIPIRIFVGGYHAKTHNRCYQTFWGVFFICSFLPYVVKRDYMECVAIYVILFFLTFTFAPLQADNKMLNVYEIKKYRKYALTILIMSAVFDCVFVRKEHHIIEGMLYGKIGVIFLMCFQIIICWPA